MEPICWAGIVGVVAITAALCSMFKGSCSSSKSSCGCDTKKDAPVAKEATTSAPSTSIDEKKEKAINDLIK